jgi:hypothetical protein
LTDEKRLKKAVFYLDESIYSRALDSAMQAAGANVRRVGDDVPYGSPDEMWLETVGKNKWIALMRDQRIRRRRLETEALKAHGVAAFAFTGGQETAQQTAQTSGRASDQRVLTGRSVLTMHQGEAKHRAELTVCVVGRVGLPDCPAAFHVLQELSRAHPAIKFFSEFG